ncbi:unnamed protein product [Owenia fusiformis]|uniref:Uncharacterized protein n=1 Tax=Owenia fusiformis TaxID=6347 RepID=A0A8J1TXV7_OWEFU|nr:unnamed protein product [Owenia fusiformis]
MSSTKVSGTALEIPDIVVIVVYFIFILFVGLWTSRSNRGSVGGYFLAGRNMHWIPLGASLFASNVGSLHFIGLAGSGAAAGIAIGMYELNAIFVVLMLGWLFVPVYIASGVFTMPEYLKMRFGGQRIRVYLAVLSLLLYIFTKISADLFAGAIFIEQSLKWNIYISIIILLAIAAVFTITGGLTAVIWTDFIQTIIMIIGAFVLMIIGFVRVGGFEAMIFKYQFAVSNTTLHSNSTCGLPRKDYMHLFRDPVTGDIPWPGIIGITINSIWYWCADQVIVQRTLAGKNYTYSKAGTILCGYLKILPLFLMVFPGMISRILFPDKVACSTPDECWEICKSRSGCSNTAYPTMVLELMPQGARGVLLAVMLSALMSSLTSIFNSSSTIFTMDVWTRFRKQATDTELMIVGRLTVVVLVGVSIAWIPVIQASQGSQLFVYIQQVSSFLQPPICAVYILAVFWERINEQGAFWALMVGLLTGGIRFVVEYAYQKPLCGEDRPDPTPDIVKNFHYLYFGSFLFALTLLVCTVVSLLTKPIDKKYLYRLTYWTRHSKEHRENIDTMYTTPQPVEYNSQGETVILPVSQFSDKDAHQYETLGTKESEGASGFSDGHTEASKAEAVNFTEVTNTGGTVVLSEEELREEANADLPCWRRAFNWICGIEKQLVPEISDDERIAQEAKMMCIKEEKSWRYFTDINAVILMTIAVFIWGFFA